MDYVCILFESRSNQKLKGLNMNIFYRIWELEILFSLFEQGRKCFGELAAFPFGSCHRVGESSGGD